MKEPGKLTLIGDISKKEQEQLSDLLDKGISKSNTFKILESILGDRFLLFLDVFQDETLVMPNVDQIMRRISHLKIYNDTEKHSLQEVSEKYDRKPSVIKNIVQKIGQDLEFQDSICHPLSEEYLLDDDKS